MMGNPASALSASRMERWTCCAVSEKSEDSPLSSRSFDEGGPHIRPRQREWPLRCLWRPSAREKQCGIPSGLPGRPCSRHSWTPAARELSRDQPPSHGTRKVRPGLRSGFARPPSRSRALPNRSSRKAPPSFGSLPVKPRRWARSSEGTPAGWH